MYGSFAPPMMVWCKIFHFSLHRSDNFLPLASAPAIFRNLICHTAIIVTRNSKRMRDEVIEKSVNKDNILCFETLFRAIEDLNHWNAHKAAEFDN